jgi:hypothetical protein
LFKRFFFLWLLFFSLCILGIGTFALLVHWKASHVLEQASVEALLTVCYKDFTQESQTGHPVEAWDWDRLFNQWQTQNPAIEALVLVDRVPGAIKNSLGTLPADWNPLVDDPGDHEPHWIDHPSGNQFWTVVPAGTIDPRYRVWILFRQETSFPAYLHRLRSELGVAAFLFLAVFVVFYAFWGTPTRHLSPLAGALQHSLKHPEIPVMFSHDSVPGEFVPLANALSVLLESRQKDYEERQGMNKKEQHLQEQKNRYTEMIHKLKSIRDNEQTAVEKIQSVLLEANREPAMILDRTKRILAMNEPARMTLSLAGQTGVTLRHSELEEIIQAQIEIGPRSGPHRLATKDPFFGKTTTWRVHVHVLADCPDSSQLECIVVYLTQDRSSPSRPAPPGSDLPAEPSPRDSAQS